jgi:hypothetical protein
MSGGAILGYAVRYLVIAGAGGIVFHINRDSKAKEGAAFYVYAGAAIRGVVAIFLLCVLSGLILPTVIFDQPREPDFDEISDETATAWHRRADDLRKSQYCGLFIFGAACSVFAAHQSRRS